MKTLILIICLVLIGCSSNEDLDSDFVPLLDAKTQIVLKQRGVSIEQLYIKKSEINAFDKGFLSDAQRKIVNDPNVKDVKTLLEVVKIPVNAAAIGIFIYKIIKRDDKIIEKSSAFIIQNNRIISGFPVACYSHMSKLFGLARDKDSIVFGIALVLSIGSTILIYIKIGLMAAIVYSVFQFGLLGVGVYLKFNNNDNSVGFFIISILISVISSIVIYFI